MGPASRRSAGGTGVSPVEIDLHTLLGQFLAVRQEVNLQTRAVRAQQEQNNETLRQLSTALDALRQSQARGEQMRQQDLDEAIRPLLKTLIDLYDALALASREMQRLRETVLPSLEQLGTATVEPETPTVLSRRRRSGRGSWVRPAPQPPARAEKTPRQQRARALDARQQRARAAAAHLVGDGLHHELAARRARAAAARSGSDPHGGRTFRSRTDGSGGSRRRQWAAIRRGSRAKSVAATCGMAACFATRRCGWPRDNTEGRLRLSSDRAEPQATGEMRSWIPSSASTWAPPTARSPSSATASPSSSRMTAIRFCPRSSACPRTAGCWSARRRRTSGCWPRSAPSSRSSARWART